MDMNILLISSLSTFLLFFTLHCWWAATVQELSVKTKEKREKERHHNVKITIYSNNSHSNRTFVEEKVSQSNEYIETGFVFVLLMEYLLSKLIYLLRFFSKWINLLRWDLNIIIDICKNHFSDSVWIPLRICWDAF
jgi:hypothetical protein